MKGALITLWLIWAFQASAQFLHLSAGESFAHEFSTLPLVGTSATQPNQGLTFFSTLASDRIDAGESVRLEMFENSFSDTPFLTHIFNGPISGNFGRSHPDAWQDLQGAYRVTVIAGSVDIDRAFQTVYRDGSVYGNVVSVPEPSTLSLLAAGLALGLAWRRSKSRRESSDSC